MRPAARRLVWLALVSASLAPASAADDGIQAEEARSTVEIRTEGDGVVTHSVNRGFRVVTLYAPGETHPRTLLLAEEADIVRSTVEEGPRSATMRLEVSGVGKAGPRPLFRIEETGEAGAIADLGAGLPFYQVTRFGCCGARDSVSTWSLVTGRRLFSATGPAAVFDVPNSGGMVRLVAVHAAWSIDDARAFGDRHDVVALIAYASPTQPLRRVLVKVRPPATVEEMMAEPRAMLLLDGAQDAVPSATLWASDGRGEREAIAGLSIVVAFTPGNALVIPVVADDLDLAHATVSPTLELEAIALEPAPGSCSCRPPRRLFPLQAGGSSTETDGQADGN